MIKHGFRLTILSLTLFLFSICEILPAQEIIIIAHPDVSESILKKDALKEIFMGDKTTWQNGNKINFAVIRQGPVNELFLKTYIDKSSVIYIRHWKRQLLTGKKATLPRLFSSEQDVVEFVKNTAGGIGYVSGKTDISRVKKIEIIK